MNNASYTVNRTLPHPDDVGAAQTLAVLVVFSFVTGIARAWELIGAPASISVGHESLQLLREEAAELSEHNHTSHRRLTGDDDAPAAPQEP
ncbi:hypothetical protein [Rudaeicoccus suwonensis]|uniref:Uncharacterized protein n=1 Tax=Rudaeicoccus suwonensis TaxID=657409 RepID=A0A561E4G1_9MICO|nr:hypothetical protein [Rudaeicoccus suwonensis]TWE10507.1 hypothetical protein BKA23_2876 [Rudaeicoccus suwonensis]